MDIAPKILLLKYFKYWYLRKLKNPLYQQPWYYCYGLSQPINRLIRKNQANRYEVNKDRIEEHIDTSSPIDVYFNHIYEAVQFVADRKTPYMSDQTINTAYHAILVAVLYDNDTK